MVIPLDNISHAISFNDDSGGPTSLLCVKQLNPLIGGETIHVDIPIGDMERILHLHSIDPTRKFRTHGLKPKPRKRKVPGKRESAGQK